MTILTRKSLNFLWSSVNEYDFNKIVDVMKNSRTTKWYLNLTKIREYCTNAYRLLYLYNDIRASRFPVCFW